MVKHQSLLRLLNKITYALVFVVIVSLVFIAVAHAEPISSTQTTNTTITQSQDKASITNTAHAWGLQIQDYQHYQSLMQNTPSGHWYKDLDPAEVLALNSATPNEMMKYAKIQAQNIHVRVTRELAFNNLYRKAYKELYPHETPIASNIGTQNLSTMNVQDGDRVWLFTGLRTPLGSFAYERLISLVQKTPHAVLDIYFVGNDVDEKTIQTWALRAGIDPALVNKRVTLNYGTDRFNDLKKSNDAHLPYVGIVHNNKFQPITLNSIIQ